MLSRAILIDCRIRILPNSAENRVKSILFYGMDIFSARWRNMRAIPKKYNSTDFYVSYVEAQRQNIMKDGEIFDSEVPRPSSGLSVYFFPKMIVCVHRNRVSKTCKWSMLRTCLACIDGYNYSTYSSYVKHVENADTYMYLNGFDQLCNWRVLFGIQIGILASAFRVLKYFRI